MLDVLSQLYTNNVWFLANNTNIESCPSRVKNMAVLAALPGKKQIFLPQLTLLVAGAPSPRLSKWTPEKAYGIL